METRSYDRGGFHSVSEMVPKDIKGPSALITKQMIISAFCPKLSIASSCDSIAAQFGFDTMLQFFKHFETSTMTDRGFKVNIRFVEPVEKLLEERKTAEEQQRLHSTPGPGHTNSFGAKGGESELYNMRALETVANDIIKEADQELRGLLGKEGTREKVIDIQNSIYTKYFAKLVSSVSPSPYDAFNHPIMQLFVASANDEPDTVKQLVSNWRKTELPLWMDREEMLPLVVIIVNKNVADELQHGLRLQGTLKLDMGVKSSLLSVSVPGTGDEVEEADSVKMVALEEPCFTTVSEDLNRINVGKQREIPLKSKKSIESFLQDLIHNIMVPFMRRKMRVWTDEVVAPRKSLTGRLFGAGRRWGPSGGSLFGGEGKKPQQSTSSYNENEGFYYAKSPDFLIRRLGDWCFMLRDYKDAYTTYELLKKDFLNEKAWCHLSSLQEFMLISLLIGASNKISPLDVNGTGGGGITPKIIHDLINPMVDSMHYSYLSRSNLKTYTLRSIVSLAEMFICLGQSTISSSQNTEVYYGQAIKLLRRVVDGNLVESTFKGKLMERIAYIYGVFHREVEVKTAAPPEPTDKVENVLKQHYRNIDTVGATRHRKSALWLLMASRQLDPIIKPVQVELLLDEIDVQIGEAEGDREDHLWLYRDNLLLHRLKHSVQ